ncbi:peptidoglycan endopeptidase [Bacillus sp. PS06]|uniref:C40 family peptidase n=1 Tax=Bacillus sp. PS06 TaxID=2764176 RepID=UPI00177E6C90|nr:peptidoglycan endopeptidase [Bacillus sp. PS06]MBD8070497.1 LysM peptidoglycan-binding domain-containing protein [Bacillus sp. PS06]
MFVGHRIQDDQTIILHLDPSLTEFSSEFGGNHNGKKLHLNESIKQYISEKLPAFNPTTVKVMIGTFVVATVAFASGPLYTEAASNEPAVVETTQTYQVKTGDTLWSIAKAHNLTPTELKQINNLTSDMIYIGQSLNVSAANPVQAPSTYTVKTGDTLYSVSRQFNMTVNEMKILNNLSTDVIKPGQILTVKASVSPSTQQPTSTSTSIYTVKSGDSLWGIATKYNTTVAELKSLNQLPSDSLSIGQTLKIPGLQTQTEAPQTAQTYKVQAGDSLYAIAKRYNMSVSNLKSLNNLQSDTLSIGQVLKVTGQQATAPEQTKTSQQIKQELVSDTYNYLGVPYVWGGTTPAGFDCSGFVSFMFSKHGIDIPRVTSGSYYQMGTSVTRANLEPGDLVFYAVNKPGEISHVGFYVGNNQFISATSSKGIAVYSLDNSYWSQYYVGAKRVV